MLPELTAEERILLAIARERNKTHYELWWKDKIARSNKTVLSVLSKLKKRKLIESRQEERGRERKYYNITFEGLVGILKYEQAFAHIDEIAKTQKEMLPLVFGKWKFFKKQKILNEIIERLRNLIKDLWQKYYTLTLVPEDLPSLHDLGEDRIRPKDFPKPEGTPRIINVDINYPLFGLDKLPLFTSKTKATEKEKWFLKTLREDPDLRKYIDLTLDANEKKLKIFFSNAREWKHWWASLEQSAQKA